MPPEPGAWRNLTPQEKQQINTIRDSALERGLDRLTATPDFGRDRRPGRDDGDEQVLYVPVILIDFEDNQADQQTHSAEYFDNLVFSEGGIQTGSVRDFYAENSFDNVIIQGEVLGWYRAPQTYAYYTNRQYGLGNYPRNTQKLAEDAITAANDDVDFSRYDNDGDGFVDAPYIVHAGGGAEQNPNNVNLIWSHAWNVVNLGAIDGVRFRNYTTVPEDGNIGVFAHELGHGLFGLPDLYDTRNEAAGVGIWSVMSYGSWGDGGRRPVQFDSWCKAQMGMIEIEQVRWDRRMVLTSAELTGRALRLWNPDDNGNQYFLAEYRDGSGFDGELPETGLLIYHVDETMENNDHPFFPGNEGNLHDLLALEQADNNYDLEQFNNPGDDGDPYPGIRENSTFDNDSEPGSKDYSGNSTGVAVRNISITENGIDAEWVVGVDGPAVVEQTLHMRATWNLVSLNVMPDNLNVPNIVAPLVDQEVLRFVKDGSGRFYTPSHDFNNIPFWDVRSGYYINLSEATDLVIEGEGIEFDSEIPIHDGWQLIAYYPRTPIRVQDALASLGDSVELVKDGAGKFYYPRRNFSNMDLMAPGQGYLLKVSGDHVLRYPER